ncbi:MAG: hypothetical protein AAF696_27065, partial [Bacteroidota bacterium]
KGTETPKKHWKKFYNKTLRGIINISYFYNNYLGGRFQSAEVSFFIQPAEEFIFTSNAKWEGENFESAVLEGIKDGFQDIGLDINKGISVELQEVVLHKVDSTWKSFYIASRIAIRTRKDIRELRKTPIKNGSISSINPQLLE